MKSVCFTGHRNVRITAEIQQNLLFLLENLIQQGVLDFYAGGALGWDTFCASMVLCLKRSYPQARLHLVLPCMPEVQTLKWTETQKEEYRRILFAADSTEFVSQEYDKTCMKKRNAKLVAYADICICYYTKRSASGTGQTVRMAQKKEDYNLQFCAAAIHMTQKSLPQPQQAFLYRLKNLT